MKSDLILLFQTLVVKIVIQKI